MQDQLAHSRTRYADLYDFSPIGYASLDEHGVIEDINIMGGKLLGDNPHSLVGKSFSDFIAAADVESFRDYLRHCRCSPKKRTIELHLVPREKPPIDVQLITMATRDANRSTFQFRMAIIDDTVRKRAEADVFETQKRLEQIVADRTAELTSERRQREDAERFLYEASSVLAISLDYDVTLFTLARAGVPLLADSCVVDMVQDDTSIKRVAAAHVQSRKEEALYDLNHVPLSNNVICTAQAELRDKTMAVPLVVRGTTVGAIRLMLEREGRTYNPFDLALAEDLADRAAIALDNATLYRKELEANRLKDEFLAMVSHELRTPLMPIFGTIYKLRTCRADDQDLQSALDMIERNAKSQARIVEELLDISRMKTGKLDFNLQPADLASIVEGAVAVVRPSAEALGIEVKTCLQVPVRLVWCDRDRIQQMIWNLLSNAMKFTPQGGAIEVRLDNSPGWAHIRVADTGIGISRDFLPHVFDRFRQSDRFATRMHGGLGIGLSIVRYIVERHGGRVSVESRGEGQGTTFTVDLPYS